MSEQSRKVVIYTTKYGSTKQYAEWIAEELKCDIYEKNNFKPIMFDNYETVIYGGSLYAGGIIGISLIKNNFEKLINKRIIIFSVGMSPSSEKIVTTIKDKNFTEEMKRKAEYYHLRGAFNYVELGFIHRLMMRIMKKVIEKKDSAKRTQEENSLLALFSEPHDFKSKENIKTIIKNTIN